MSNHLKIGQWVNSYTKGIYRVEKVFDRYYDESDRFFLGDNKIGDRHKDPIVVSKRLVNSKFKKSIGYDKCSAYFISPIDGTQENELEKVIKNNPEYLTALENYQIPTLISTHWINLQIDSESDLQKVQLLVNDIKKGRSFLDIENEMKQLNIHELIRRHLGNYDILLFNFDEEYIDKRKIWRDAELKEKYRRSIEMKK
jgi:hypothetical protein